MRKLTTITTLALLIIITLMSQPGCSKEKETPAPESNRWLELMSVLPANENTLKAVYLQDFAYLAEKTQQYPQISAEYAITRNLPLFGSSPRSYSDEEWKETLGFVMADVDQTIYAGALPLDYYEAVCGRFSRDDIDIAVKTGPMKTLPAQDLHSCPRRQALSFKLPDLLALGHDVHRVRALGRQPNIRFAGQTSLPCLDEVRAKPHVKREIRAQPRGFCSAEV